MATTTLSTSTNLDLDQCVALRAVGWKGYSKILKLRGDRGVPRAVYLDGDLYLMSPSRAHERLKYRLGLFVTVLTEELDIPCQAAGSTTLRRRKKDVGVEGDQTFYLANVDRVQGKAELDLRTDPPPDLAIEAVHTHPADEAVEVYRRLGVPEVWICDETELQILVLDSAASYTESSTSALFPFLTTTEILAYVTALRTATDNAWLKHLRGWIREIIVPRLNA